MCFVHKVMILQTATSVCSVVLVLGEISEKGINCIHVVLVVYLSLPFSRLFSTGFYF